MSAGIYSITSPSNKVYIGQASNLSLRFTQYHRFQCKSQTKIYYSLKKYGADAHRFEVLMPLKDNLSQPIMTYWEQFFMDYYRGLNIPLLNIREAGTRGRISEETKRKQSLALRGRKRNPLSEEHKQKLRVANLGKPCSLESRMKKSATLKANFLKNITGCKLTPEQIKAIREINIVDGRACSLGLHQRRVAKMFGVSPSVIHSIRHRKTWKHL